MATTSDRISKTPGVCGGDACIHGSRFTVWGLVESRHQGLSDAEILRAHPSLTSADLGAAWEYHREHPLEIERALWENEAGMTPHDSRHIPLEMMRRGRQLGFSDDEIRDAFEPPLSTEALRSANKSDDATAIGA